MKWENYVMQPRKFKRGIGSLFDPVLTLWGGGHIGSSRMEQSYCTSGFFRQRVNARNHSNYQPTPERRSIIAYGKRENARRDKCVICFFFFSCSVLRFPNFPGEGTTIISPLFPPRFKCCDWHVWSLKVSGASEGMNSVYCFFLSVDNLILIILNGICVHKIDVLDSVYSAYDRPTLIFENHIIFKVHFSSNFIRVKSSKLPSKKVKQFSNKFKHRPPPLCPSFKWFCCLLDNFCTIGTV